MFSQPTFIVFEGLDGSGKSTCAAQLAEHIGAELMTTPSPRVRRYRDDLIESLGSSQEARQLFYLATVFAASDEVAALLQRGLISDNYSCRSATITSAGRSAVRTAPRKGWADAPT